ncbi:MAG TPA: anti-sigma factor [Ramlibacter sp.]|nr:anti-sigma factor [Ramlibacter sp.]
MNEDKLPPPDEAELHAYVDGRLPPPRRAAVEARLATDAEAARRVRAWSAQRELLRGLHGDVLAQPVPPHLEQAARQLHDRGTRVAQWRRWGGMAAAVLVAFGIGWASHGEWQARGGGLRTQPVAAFARQAVAAHVVYLPEVRHPVEVEAAQQQHLVQWLSKRLNRPLKIPDLAPAGYELVGGRLLPGDGGARAQFMFQNAAGERVTLYVGAIEGARARGMDETAFRFASADGMSSFYWVDQGFGYALTGKLPRQGLLVLAESVYRQL